MFQRKYIFSGILAIVSVVAIASVLVLGMGEQIDKAACNEFEEIAQDLEKNDKLKVGLAQFINDEENLSKLNGRYNPGFWILNESNFSVTSFPWIDVFDAYPTLQRHAEIALTYDRKIPNHSPPYRILEVGVYSGRTLLIYENENLDEYVGGQGIVQLKGKPTIKCNVTFSRGVPIQWEEER